ncbi:MAG: cold shock domain-containing protein [Bacteroidales bacterium]
MARAREVFNKKDREKAMLVKRKEKEKKKEERKVNSRKSKGLDDMLAYVDAYGNIVSSPPDPGSRQEIKAEDIQISISKKEDIEQANSFRTGTISFFNDAKGFGFIRDDESGERIFVHVINLESPVKENDKVTFETSRGARGLNAVNVKPA